MNLSRRAALDSAPKSESRIKWLPNTCLPRGCACRGSLFKHDAVHDAAGHEGETPGNKKTADVGADHGAAMGANIVRPGAIKSARHAEQRYRHKDMNWA